MDEHDKLDDVVEAKNEFSGNIMKRFVGRREYEAKNFKPHQLRVHGDGQKARMEFEISQTQEKVVLAAWDGKIFKFMPDWRPREEDEKLWDEQCESTRKVYEILCMSGMIEVDGILPLIIEPVVTFTKGQLSMSVKKVLAPDWDRSGEAECELGWSYFSGPGPWYGEPVGDVDIYAVHYPYIVDVENMRIVVPDVEQNFLEETLPPTLEHLRLHRKRFLFDILSKLASDFPDDYHIPEEIRGEFNKMKSLIAAVKELRPLPPAHQIVVDEASCTIVEPVARLLVETQDNGIKMLCCKTMTDYPGVVEVPDELDEQVKMKLLDYRLRRAETGKA